MGRLESPGAKQHDGIGCEQAIRATAVRDDGTVVRQLAEP
jgi:hypothetical protein